MGFRFFFRRGRLNSEVAFQLCELGTRTNGLPAGAPLPGLALRPTRRSCRPRSRRAIVDHKKIVTRDGGVGRRMAVSVAKAHARGQCAIGGLWITRHGEVFEDSGDADTNARAPAILAERTKDSTIASRRARESQ